MFCIFLHEFFASAFCKDYLCSLYEETICARNFKGPYVQASFKGPSVPATLRDHYIKGLLYEGTICARNFKGPSVPAILRDHLCPQCQGTICAQTKKEAISAPIVWDYLCPKCKGLVLSERLRNFNACNNFFSFAYVTVFVYNFLCCCCLF